jgi:hypothetical protein
VSHTAAAAFLTTLALAASAQEPVAPLVPKTFALVSSVGDQFYSVTEEHMARTGTRLEPYKRNLHTVPDNALNRLVLASLDRVVAKIEPESKRIYLAVDTPRPRSETAQMQELAIEKVVEHLKAMPERAQWHRIVVATPAYRMKGADGLPGRIQGSGIFIEAACTGEIRYCHTRTKPPASDMKVQTPSGEEVSASYFVAPYLAIKIWILDPRTFAVLDSQEAFEHQKYYDPESDSMNITQNLDRRFLATKIVEIVERTTREAVMSTELRGTVEVKERGPVEPKK